jgi:hypothetical protein
MYGQLPAVWPEGVREVWASHFDVDVLTNRLEPPPMLDKPAIHGIDVAAVSLYKAFKHIPRIVFLQLTRRRRTILLLLLSAEVILQLRNPVGHDCSPAASLSRNLPDPHPLRGHLARRDKTVSMRGYGSGNTTLMDPPP